VGVVIESGVARVVIGATDPDPRVSGRGIAALQDAGIEVDVLDSAGARAVDPAYFRHRETGLPTVTLKTAMTLDGSVAAGDGTSRWITGEQARADAHLLRSQMDAVIVGAGTLRSDDPSLDVRLDGYDGHQPRPVIVAGEEQLPGGQQLWSRHPVVVASTEIGIPSGDLLVVEGGRHPDPRAACVALAGIGLLDLLLEGGPTLAGEWWRAGVVTRGVTYIAGLLGAGSGIQPFGGDFATLADANVVTITGVRSLGADLRVDYERD
jgi:diaminohydroxyphosphoribosylaminopyrimidine deaminase/5-amino-6-(5-phosphoribosylamino)uracil reductase